MAGISTLGTVITAALNQAANPGIATQALDFVKELFHHLYLTRDFGFNRAEASLTIASGEISLSGVTRFRNVNKLRITGLSTRLEEKPYKDLWDSITEDNETSTTGTPQYFAVSDDRTKIVLWPKPDSTYTAAKMLYYKIPDTSAWTTATTPEFEDTLAIRLAVVDFALNHDKEPLQLIIERQVPLVFASYQSRTDPTGRANQPTLRWGANFNKIPSD